MGFSVAPAFEAGSVAAADWPLCHVRLQDDTRFPWLILIPRVEGVVELEDLSIEDRARHLEGFIRGYARFAKLPQPQLAPV